MRQEKTVTLTEVLAQGALASLRQRSGLIHRLDTLLGFYLDARLRQLVRVTSYQDGSLVLTCTNSTVAGQLRYLSRIYMQQLRQHDELCELVRIQAVIGHPSSASSTARKPGQPLRRLSADTAALLLHLSEDLEGGEVSEALRRLARHTDTPE